MNREPENLHSIEFTPAIAGAIAKADLGGNLQDGAYFSQCLEKIAEGMMERREAPSFSAALAYADRQLRQFSAPVLTRPVLSPEKYSEELEARAEWLLTNGKVGSFKDGITEAARELAGLPKSQPAPASPAPAAPLREEMRSGLADPVVFHS